MSSAIDFVNGIPRKVIIGGEKDIKETSFSGSNNVSAPANVTGLVFSNSEVRAATIVVGVDLQATADKYEVFELSVVQKGSDWDLAHKSLGDESGVEFSITSSGQIQYTSPDSAGFVSLTMRFRASTTQVD